MDTCIIKPCVKNGNGDIVDSKLFEGLLSLFPKNREEAWRHYDIATDEKFLSKYAMKASYDENGEIKLKDYAEIAGIQDKNFPVENALNKELQSGKYSYQEAIEKVEAFNSSRTEGSKYIATIRATENPNVFSIFVSNDISREKATMKKIIKGRHLNDKIIKHLASHGVSVQFIEDNPSRYSTENATTNANGLYQLIQFNKNGTSVELAEEAGHFVVGMMGDHVLVGRLEKLVEDTKVQKQILGDEYKTKNLGSNPAREIAGVLVGRAIENKLEHDSIFYQLTHRLLRAANKLIAKLSADEISLSIIEAEEIADRFAEAFITDSIPEGTKKALQTLETFYHRTLKDEDVALNYTIDQLVGMAKEIKAHSPKLGEEIDKIISDLGEMSSDVVHGLKSIDGIVTSVLRLAEFAEKYLIKDIGSTEALVTNLPPLEMAQRLQDESSKFICFVMFTRRLENIIKQIEPIQSNKSNTFNRIASKIEQESNISYKNALQLLYSIVYKHVEYKSDEKSDTPSLTRSLYDIAMGKMKRIAALYLEQTHGAEFITSTSGLLWDLTRGKTTQVTFDQVVNYIYEDDNVLTHFCCNLANSKDIGAQLIVKAIKEANHKAYIKMAEAQAELDILDKKAKKAGITDYRRFYTVDENGELTGNLVSIVEDSTDAEGNVMPMEIEWHKYERDHKEFLNKKHAEFINSEEGKKYANLSEPVKILKFQAWVSGAEEAFFREHTVWSSKYKRRMPKISLYGKPTNLTRKELDWFKEYNVLFDKYKSWINSPGEEEVDEENSIVSRPSKGKMLPYLAPQVRGSMVNTIGNIMNSPVRIKKKASAIGYALWGKAVEFISREHIDINETSHHNWNTEEDDAIDKYYKESGRIDTSSSRLLPLYYVSRLKDTGRLDTNLIAATMQFVTMAAKYEASYKIQSPLEITREVLTRRDRYSDEAKAIKADDPTDNSIKKRIKKTWETIKVPKVPYTTDGINEYVDALYYGMNYGKLTELLDSIGAKGVSKNTIALAGKAMVLWYLGGNIFSAAVNLLTGNIEIFKEAWTSQHFDLADWTSAWATYVIHSPNLLLDVLKADDTDKINLMAVKFNSLDKTAQKFQNYRTWGERLLLNTLSPANILMSGYSLGEHVMQNVPYIAMLKHTKLYTLNGTKTSLWDALEKTKKSVKIGNQEEKGVRSILDIIEPHFKTLEDVKLYKHLQSSILALKNSSVITTNVNSLHPDVLQHLVEKEHYTEAILNSKDPQDFIKILEDLSTALTFNEIDESTMSQKAREVTNRMHGIYNKMDKTIFHRSILGMLLCPFKGYAFGMMMRRFLGNKYNVVLDDDDEGSMISALKIGFHTAFKDIPLAAKNIALSIIGQKDHTRKELAKAAIDHLGMAAGKYISVVMPEGELKSKLLDYAGMNYSQSYNLRRTIFDYSFIAGLSVLLTTAAAMAMGTEDDDELDEMNLEELLNYCDKKGIEINSEDIEGEYDIVYNKKLVKKLKNAQVRDGYKRGDKNEFNKRLTDNIRDQIKQVNRDMAEAERPLWNITYYLVNRLYREQAAFNTIHGFNLESSSLLDLVPLSVRALVDMYQVASSITTAEGFYDGKVNIGGYDIYVEDAVIFANMPAVTKGDRKLKQMAVKALNERWETLYYDKELKKYLYDKKKIGHHQRYDKKWTTTLKYKYNPVAKTQFIMHNGDQAVRDFNFGTLK